MQPIEILPQVLEANRHQLANVREATEQFRRAEAAPHQLDDATLGRAMSVHQESLSVAYPRMRAVEKHWRSRNPTTKQIAQLDELSQLLDLLEKETGELLALGRGLAGGTIDRIMGMSDFDLAQAVLSGQIKPPSRGLP